LGPSILIIVPPPFSNRKPMFSPILKFISIIFY
jgi:hypothetical protein